MNVTDALLKLKVDCDDLWTPRHVQRLDSFPTAIDFLRDFVSKSTPVIFSGAASSWRGAKWDLDHLTRRCAGQEVSVNVSPDGRADAIKVVSETGGARLFVKPEERRMSMKAFCGALENPSSFDGVPYLSRQNDSLREEFTRLEDDIPHCLEFAREAFGNEPDAVNLWIGDERSISSCHKDHYENIYCVLSGLKRFTLFPPSAAPSMKERPFRSGIHRHHEGHWTVELEDSAVNWVDAETEIAEGSMPGSLVIDVGAGDILYLPAMYLLDIQATLLLA